MTLRRSLISLALLGLLAAQLAAADLQPRTVAAFDRYVRAAEAQMPPEPFLRIDALSETDRRARLAEVKRGEVYIERLSAREAGKTLDVPGGLIHHWLGAVFVPGTTLRQAVDLLQDYNRHAEIFRPAIARSKLVSRTGETFRVDLRFYMKKVITVVVDTENEAKFTYPGPDRAQSRIYSLRVAEVADPDTPKEHQLPPGQDGGYLWRLYTYWRFLERDGGTYIQCEAISLTRSIPALFGWLVGPFVSSIPRESLAFTLDTTRKTLAARQTSPRVALVVAGSSTSAARTIPIPNAIVNIEVNGHTRTIAASTIRAEAMTRSDTSSARDVRSRSALRFSRLKYSVNSRCARRTPPTAAQAPRPIKSDSVVGTLIHSLTYQPSVAATTYKATIVN